MSAGGISYSGVNGNRKVTLPSVESWGSNMNIIKDPPKSITTRKIEKVSDTQHIEKMIEQSINDRYGEHVQEYPRGINPSVEVSYSNYGNNGGKLMHIGKGDSKLGGWVNGEGSGREWRSGQVSGGHTMPKYTHRINLDGDFRPPVFTETQLAPLSRMPRNVTNVNTNAHAPNWVNRDTCDTSKYKTSIKSDLLNTSVPATSTYYINPMTEANNRKLNTSNVKSSINEVRNKEAYTQKTQNVHNTISVSKPQRGISNHNNTEMYTNQSKKQGQMLHVTKPERGISNKNNTEMYTNQSKKQGQMLHVTKPHRGIAEKINTEMYANISTEEHNEAGALKHEPNLSPYIVEGFEHTNVHTNHVSSINNQNDATKHQINPSQYINDMNNSNIHSRTTGFGNIDVGMMADNYVGENVIKNVINNDITANKTQNYQKTRQDMVNIKLNELNNKTINTVKTENYYADNQNRNVRQLENRTPITNVVANQSGDHNKHHMFGNNKQLLNIQNLMNVNTPLSNNREEYMQNRVRDAKLQPTLQINNSFEPRATKPQEFHSNHQYNLSSVNQSTNKQAYNNYAERFQEPKEYMPGHSAIY